jgi:preprotein translocase subunit YajC
VNNLLPFLIFMIVIVGLLAFSARARRRQAQAELERAGRIAVGTEVMTTSGLYGTVVARNDDETVLLSIAPGVEVKWALPALRDLSSLPTQYRPGHEPGEQPADGGIDLDKPRTRDNGGADPD